MTDNNQDDLRLLLGEQKGLLQGLYNLVTSFRSDLKDTNSRIDEVDDKVTKLEHWRAYVVGIAAAIATIVGFIINMVLP